MDLCHATVEGIREELFCETIQKISLVEYFTANVTIGDNPVTYKCNSCSYLVQKGSKQKILKLDKFANGSSSVSHLQPNKSL